MGFLVVFVCLAAIWGILSRILGELHKTYDLLRVQREEMQTTNDLLRAQLSLASKAVADRSGKFPETVRYFKEVE